MNDPTVNLIALSRRSFLWGMAGLASASMSTSSLLFDAVVASPPAPRFRLVDVTAASGIKFRHNSGAYGGKLLPETLGAGCAFLDYDRDGWQDILLVNGANWPGHKREHNSEPSTLKLYRNNRNGTFSDVTHTAGLVVRC